jgi:hypothetical protein
LKGTELVVVERNIRIVVEEISNINAFKIRIFAYANKVEIKYRNVIIRGSISF